MFNASSCKKKLLHIGETDFCPPCKKWHNWPGVSADKSWNVSTELRVIYTWSVWLHFGPSKLPFMA